MKELLTGGRSDTKGSTAQPRWSASLLDQNDEKSADLRCAHLVEEYKYSGLHKPGEGHICWLRAQHHARNQG